MSCTSVGESWRGSWRNSWLLNLWKRDSFMGSDAIECTVWSVHLLGMNSGSMNALPAGFGGMLVRKAKHFARSVVWTVLGQIHANGALAPPFLDIPRDAMPVIDTSSTWILLRWTCMNLMTPCMMINQVPASTETNTFSD